MANDVALVDMTRIGAATVTKTIKVSTQECMKELQKLGFALDTSTKQTRSFQKGILDSFNEVTGIAKKSAKNVDSYTTGLSVTWAKASVIAVGIRTAYQEAYKFFSGALNQFTHFGDALDKMSKRTGIAASDLSRLKFAAEQSGSSMEELGNGIRDFNKNLQSARNGDLTALKNFRELGLSPEILGGKTVKEQLLMIADALKNCGDEAKKTKVAVSLFGEAGYKLLPMLNEGSVGINALSAEADRMGIAISEEDVANAVQLTDEINRMKSSFSALVRNGVAAFAGTFKELIATARSWIEALSSGITYCRGLIQGLGNTIVFLGKTAAAFLATAAAVEVYNASVNRIANASWKSLFSFKAWKSFFMAAGGWIIGLVGKLGMVGSAIAKIGGLFKWAALVVAANPVTASVVALGAATVGLGYYLCGTRKEFEKINDAQQKNRELTEKQIESDNERIKRLKELQALGRLTSAELTEAQTLLQQLGQSGMNTKGAVKDGRVSLESGSAYSFNKKNKSLLLQDLEKEKKEIWENMQKTNANIGELGEDRWNNVFRKSWLGWFTGTVRSDTDALAEQSAEFDKQYLKYKEVSQKIKELRSGQSKDKSDAEILAKRQKEADLAKKAAGYRKTLDELEDKYQRSKSTKEENERYDIKQQMADQKFMLQDVLEDYRNQAKKYGIDLDSLLYDMRPGAYYSVVADNLTKEQAEVASRLFPEYDKYKQMLEELPKRKKELLDNIGVEEEQKKQEEILRSLAEMETNFAEKKRTEIEREIGLIKKENEEYIKLLKTKKDITKLDLDKAEKENQKRLDEYFEKMGIGDEKVTKAWTDRENARNAYYQSVENGENPEQRREKLKAKEEAEQAYNNIALDRAVEAAEADFEAKKKAFMKKKNAYYLKDSGTYYYQYDYGDTAAQNAKRNERARDKNAVKEALALVMESRDKLEEFRKNRHAQNMEEDRRIPEQAKKAVEKAGLTSRGTFSLYEASGLNANIPLAQLTEAKMTNKLLKEIKKKKDMSIKE